MMKVSHPNLLKIQSIPLRKLWGSECKVDTGWANKVESDRFLNPNNMVCPLWNGMDVTGRQVCADSFYTKSRGCNSASDRVDVENSVSRPQYMEYVTLSSQGIQGNIYGNSMHHADSKMRTKDLKKVHKLTGQYGQVTDFGSQIIPSCGYAPYKEAMSQEHTQSRKGQAAQMGYEGYSRRNQCGM